MVSARKFKSETTARGQFIDGVGVGLRAPHYAAVLGSGLDSGLDSGLEANRDRIRPITWFEAISENYMGLSSSAELNGGRPLAILESIRRNFPIVLHGVSMSIGSTDELNIPYLQKLKLLIERIEPAWVSDHLCWTGVNGENLHDLLPLPLTYEALNWVAERIDRVQNILKRQLVIENVSSYLSFSHSEMTESAFLAALTRKTDCRLLLDINNVYVSSTNHGFDPRQFLSEIPRECVAQIHLAGHSRLKRELGPPLLIDTHDGPVCTAVWQLFREAISRLGRLPTLIEWDEQIPEFDILRAEAACALKFMEAGNAEFEAELT